MYENRTGPDDDLMQATRKGTVTGHGYHSDDDADEKLDREVRMRRKWDNYLPLWSADSLEFI